ncbi:hypothetical protein PR003_g4169 [Phytophthora rubi]|uniref:MalT-like TPR region domain-containing protein n=1 Tax=Phytophthora rubi TaxID=129364 RepID=A0A6A3NKZ2_9STRA|nr:hypothetical protein PR002_g4001 [Phytophthora rubi]KAE9050403.1 hypothetical protein PR001_g2406 [Phytophthora rubi]KAE9352845.1 hypothetical protein PR003_g4169 [Phytophthora rubi]
MLLRSATCAARRAVRVASSTLRCSQSATLSAFANAAAQRGTPRFIPIVTRRELSTSATKDAELRLLESIEQSREEEDSERELQQSLELYDILKQRKQQDADAFEVAFGIARIYDDQLDDGATATTYYQEALSILEAISTEVTAWGACMRVTTLGALAVCYEDLGQPEEAEKYFDDAIGAYEEHCDKAPGSEDDATEEDISLLSDLNATASMIHYHYAGSLLAQERWEEAKNVTKIAVVLAENSSMPAEDLEELQHSIHELWLEMD